MEDDAVTTPNISAGSNIGAESNVSAGSNDGAESIIGADQASIRQALSQLDDALQELTTLAESDELATLEDEALATFAQDFEHLRNRLGLVDHQIIGDADRRNLGNAWLMRNTTGLLRQLLQLSPAQARARQDAAKAVATGTTLTGEALPAKHPALAKAHRQGLINPAQLTTAIETLATLDKAGINPSDLADAENTLTDLAARFEPNDFRKAAVKLTDVLLPDGFLDHEGHQRMRDFHLRKNRDGSFSPGGRITPTLGAQILAALTPLAKPRPDADGPDPRTAGQRLHDGLQDAISRLLRVGGLPSSGGTPATVIVTIDLNNLLNRTGHGETSDGTLLTVEEILRLANEAEIIPAAFRKSGLPMDLGRTRRIANKDQTLAMIARDGGCSFPGCTASPEICERHHIVAWLDDGLTNMNNLTLLCGYHHREFQTRGWICTMINNLPHWTPPRWKDPEQAPLLHHRIQQRFGLAA